MSLVLSLGYRPWMIDLPWKLVECLCEWRINAHQYGASFEYFKMASKNDHRRFTQACFFSSQFFTSRSPRTATLTHMQVFIRVNVVHGEGRSNEFICILRSWHLFPNGTIIKNITIQTRSMYNILRHEISKDLCEINRDDSAKGS